VTACRHAHRSADITAVSAAAFPTWHVNCEIGARRKCPGAEGAIDVTEKENAGRLGFLDALARLFRPEGITAPLPEPQEGTFAKLEADFETALRTWRQKVAEQAATAAPRLAGHENRVKDFVADRQRRMDECHRAMREDIEKMHTRLGTGLSPADFAPIDAVLRRLDTDATEGKDSHSLMPRLRYTVGTRFRLESGALAVARLIALMNRANLAWPEATHYDPHATPEQIESSRRRRMAEIRESFLAQDFKKTAERMVGIVRTWGADYPDRGSPLWEETVLGGAAAGIRGRLLSDFVEVVEREQDVVLSRTEAAIGKELAALRTAVTEGVHSIEQANAVVASSLRALDEVVPELVWQLVRSRLPQARGEFAS
jgi:hypothetical protein